MWPLLTVETEVNGDSKSTNEREGSFLGWFIGLVVLEQEFCVLPWLHALVGPVQNILFLIVHYLNSFTPIARQAGQAVVL